MITEKSTIKCEAVFNEEHTHRFSFSADAMDAETF